MAFIKYLLPALAATQVVLADDPCSPSKPFTIESPSDASKIANCKTFKGDIEISNKFSGNLDLDGIQKITGDISSVNATVSEFGAPQLSSIEGKFSLNQLTMLKNLNFPSLESVGSINWEGLPQLQSLNFGKGVSKANDVSIANTGLASLKGISLDTVGDFQIQNNNALESVNVNALKNASGIINFSGNKHSLNIKLPNLDHVKQLTVTNVSSLVVPSLHELTGILGLYGGSFQNFSAPNLTFAGDVTFSDNKQLNNVSLPELKNLTGSLNIYRNDELKDINLPSLKQVGGAVDWSGKFDNVSTPQLEKVKGTLNIKSTGHFSCDPYKKLADEHKINGKFDCKASDPNPTTKGGSSGTISGGGVSGKPSSSGNAAVGNTANVPAMGMAALFGAMLQYAL